MPMRFTAHAGTRIEVIKKSQFEYLASISPNVIYTYQDGFMQLNLGLYYKYSIFTLGAWWREGDSFIITGGIEMDRFNFGYSYDITTSTLTNASGGSHELSLVHVINCRKKVTRYRTISCPAF